MIVPIYKFLSRVRQSSLGLRLVKGGFWSLFGNILSKGTVLLSTILVAHILGKNVYGEYSIIRTTIFMFIALASLGVGSVTTKYISQYRDSNLQKAYNIYLISTGFSIVFGLIIAISVYFSSRWIAKTQLDAEYLTNSIKYGALLLFFCTINGAQTGSLAGFENFKDIAINSFIASVIELIGTCLMAYYWGINGALVGSALGYFFLTLINNRIISKEFGHSVTIDWKLIQKEDINVIWIFGLPAALCNLLVIFALWMSRTYLVRQTNFGEIAIYNAADQVKTFILFIPIALSTIVLPILTNIKQTGSYKQYNKVLKSNIIINIGISGIIALVVSILAGPILSLWGKSFDDPMPLILLAISAIFSSFATVVGQAIASQGKMWVGFICNLIWAVLVVALSYHFIGKGMGASGLALSILIAYIAHGLYQYMYLKIWLMKPVIK